MMLHRSANDEENSRLVAIAAAIEGAPRLEINSLKLGESGDFSIQRPAPASEYRFSYGGLGYEVMLKPGTDGPGFEIKAAVGQVPYTAESQDARQAVQAIVKHSQSLAKARFSIDEHQAIWLTGEAVITDALTPEVVMLEIVLTLQEARPYLKLLSNHL